MSPAPTTSETATRRLSVSQGTSSKESKSTLGIRISDSKKRAAILLFEKMKDEEKWQLQSGRYVEDRMLELVKTLKYEHPAMYCILDVADENWIAFFSEEELAELEQHAKAAIQYPALSQEMQQFLRGIPNTDNLEAIYTYLEARQLNHTTQSSLIWLKFLLQFALLLFKSTVIPTQEKEKEFELAEYPKRYIVNGLDVSKKFHEFQLSLQRQDSKFHAETHVHQLLALSSILLLKPHRMNSALVDEFGAANMEMIISDVIKRLGIVQQELPMDIMTAVTKVIEKTKQKKLTRSQAVVALLAMEKDLTKSDFKMGKSVANIIAKIPSIPIMETVTESKLCSRYLDPFLCGLFDDPDAGVFFRWTNENISIK